MLTKRFRRILGILLLALPTYRAASGETTWRLQQEQDLPTAAPALRAVFKLVAGPSEVRLYLVLPDAKRTRLRVLDNPGNIQGLEQAMREQSCLAGVNGGFFHPDFTPLGLVVSDGHRLHPFESVRLLSGLLVVSDRQPKLMRTKEYSLSMKPSEALQAGPFLIDRGRAVRGLNRTRPAQRTLILTDSHGRYGLVAVESTVALADLADILATPGIVHELKIARALNLDGGASTALWVQAPEDEDLYVPGWTRVRNFVCVQGVSPPVPRDKPTN